MKIVRLRACTLSIAASAVILVACGTQQITAPVAAVGGSSDTTGLQPRRSWMRPNATSQDLLYVTQSDTTIDVFSYPGGELEGQLTGQDEPGAECVDGAGDIFIPNYKSDEILEYPHGGTKPIAKYKDSKYYPSSCAIDPLSGQLAVTEPFNDVGAPSGVAFYKIGHPKPRKRMSDIKITAMTDCAYDGAGNLYIFGVDGSHYRYGLLQRGKKFIIELHLTPTIAVPGQMQWDGSHLVVSYRGEGTLVEYTIDGHTGTKFGTTTLKGTSQTDYFWISGSSVVAPEFLKTRVGVWNYPGGGKPTEQIATTYYPGSVVVSPASPRP